MEQVSLTQFYEMLKAHDWLYYMSDDSSVERRGAAQERVLLEIAKQSLAHEQLYTDYVYYICGLVQGNKNVSKPEKPKENNNGDQN
jgi:hypothetical protein